MSLANTIKSVQLLELPRFEDRRGSLSVVESQISIPFEIKRVFYLYDVPTGNDRGAHAHKELYQFLICLSGGFDVLVDDGINREIIHLNRPWRGLLIPPMIWASEINFDAGAVCLALASDHFHESDYIRDYQEFLKLKRDQDE